MTGKWARLRESVAEMADRSREPDGTGDPCSFARVLSEMDQIEASPDKPQAETHEHVYRVSFELVRPEVIARYTNRETRRQSVPSAQIPEQHWQRAERVTTDPWDQYRTLARWAAEESQHVRNVRLEIAVNPEDLEWAAREPAGTGRMVL